MRPISPELQSLLAAPKLRVVTCWHLRRADGVELKLTDHDEDLELPDGTYVARAIERCDARTRVGLATDPGGVEMKLDHPDLRDADLKAGAWDEAKVMIFQISLDRPLERFGTWQGQFGRMTLAGESVSVELVGIQAGLARRIGRHYGANCDAALGDARCQLDLTAAGRTVQGTLQTVVGDQVRVSLAPADLSGRAAQDFVHGALVVPGLGRRIEIFAAQLDGAILIADIAAGTANGLQAGDAINVQIGCDKRFETCQQRFQNADNFRGFPHVPRQSILFANAVTGATTYAEGAV